MNAGKAGYAEAEDRYDNAVVAYDQIVGKLTEARAEIESLNTELTKEQELTEMYKRSLRECEILLEKSDEKLQKERARWEVSEFRPGVEGLVMQEAGAVHDMAEFDATPSEERTHEMRTSRSRKVKKASE